MRTEQDICIMMARVQPCLTWPLETRNQRNVLEPFHTYSGRKLYIFGVDLRTAEDVPLPQPRHTTDTVARSVPVGKGLSIMIHRYFLCRRSTRYVSMLIVSNGGVPPGVPTYSEWAT
jgi:hypothetical protein